jgi:hypothetical protein
VAVVAAAVSEDGTGTTERPSVRNPLSKHPHPGPLPVRRERESVGAKSRQRLVGSAD